MSLTIDDADLEFQNSIVKIVALGSLQELSVAETIVGPLEEGKEYEVMYWIALELIKAGFARFYEDVPMTFKFLNKFHWTETKLQTGRQITLLPEFFYPKLRRYMEELKQKAVKNASFAREYDQALRLGRDIINSRLRKIVNLATYSPTESIIVESLSREERRIFESVNAMVSEWQSKILTSGGSK